MKTIPTTEFEAAHWAHGEMPVGVDETGVGSLLGPAFAAAVRLPLGFDARLFLDEGLTDSKQLSAKAIARLVPLIQQHADRWALGAASAKEIDRGGIRRATVLAMQRALARMGVVSHVLLDGVALPRLGYPHTALVKGDARVLSISAASVLAKWYRDRCMARIGHRPGMEVFGLADNCGYGTDGHFAALAAHGPSRHHRVTFVDKGQFNLFS